jgi:alanine racemase
MEAVIYVLRHAGGYSRYWLWRWLPAPSAYRPVWSAGKIVPLIGKVSMDMLSLDLRGCGG